MRIEISYNALKNFRTEELKIVLLKYFKKFDIIRITNLPLINFQSQLTKKFMEKIKTNPNIQLAEINGAKSYIDIVNRGKKHDPIIPEIIPSESEPTSELERERFICEKVLGKSSNYGEFTIMQWNKEKEVKLNSVDKALAQTARQFLIEYPNVTNQGFEDSVRMPSASYASKGCFVASYLTAADYNITDNVEMQRMLTSLHSNGHVKDDNNASFQVVNFLNVDRSLVIPKIVPLKLNHHYMLQVGSITLNNYVASLTKISDRRLLEEICAGIEVIMAVIAPGIFEQYTPNNKDPRFTQLINVGNTQMKHDATGYLAVLEYAVSRMLGAIVGTVNVGTVEAAVLAALSGLIGEQNHTLDSKNVMSINEVRNLYSLFSAARLSRVVSCILYKVGSGHHMVIAYPHIVADHVPIFDPRWSGCNRAVMYSEKTKSWLIIHDLLYDTPEFKKYLTKIKCKVDQERYVVNLVAYAKYWDKAQQLGTIARNLDESDEYERLLKVCNRMFTVPENSTKSYENAKGTKLSRSHDMWTPLDMIAFDDLDVMEVA